MMNIGFILYIYKVNKLYCKRNVIENKKSILM